MAVVWLVALMIMLRWYQCTGELSVLRLIIRLVQGSRAPQTRGQWITICKRGRWQCSQISWFHFLPFADGQRHLCPQHRPRRNEPKAQKSGSGRIPTWSTVVADPDAHTFHRGVGGTHISLCLLGGFLSSKFYLQWELSYLLKGIYISLNGHFSPWLLLKVYRNLLWMIQPTGVTYWPYVGAIISARTVILFHVNCYLFAKWRAVF